jgi:hypothetical protein
VKSVVDYPLGSLYQVGGIDFLKGKECKEQLIQLHGNNIHKPEKQEKDAMCIFEIHVRLKGKGIETSYTVMPLMSQQPVTDLVLADRMYEVCDPLKTIVSH